jgi:hypothetical protein
MSTGKQSSSAVQASAMDIEDGQEKTTGMAQ